MTDPSNGEFHEFKKMKKWLDKKARYCMKLYPRWFDVTNSYNVGENRYWTWDCYKETNEENIEVVKLIEVCWLNVRGQFKMSELSPGVVYEIAYIVKLTKGAFGWELPITLNIIFLNKRNQKRLVSLFEKPRGEWIELSGGTEDGETGIMCFDLFEHGGHWKSGLIIEGIIVKRRKI